MVLHGLGSIGKTQLAVHFMTERTDIYSAIFWLKSQSEDKLKQPLNDIARLLCDVYRKFLQTENAEETEDTDKMIEAVRSWLSQKENCKWILLFDSCDDPKAYDVYTYLPKTCHGSVLIISRSSHMRIAKVVYMPVERLTDAQESVKILAHTSKRSISAQGQHQGLHCAFHYWVDVRSLRDRASIQTWRPASRTYDCRSSSQGNFDKPKKLSWPLKEVKAETATGESRLTLIWRGSFHHLESFCWLHTTSKSALHNTPQTLDILWQPWSLVWPLSHKKKRKSPMVLEVGPLSFNEAVSPLCNLALVEPLFGGNGYRMHNCVLHWAIHVLSSEGYTAMSILVVNCVTMAFPRAEMPSNIAIERRLLPHVIPSDSSRRRYCNPPR